jgi:hypothetical protein
MIFDGLIRFGADAGTAWAKAAAGSNTRVAKSAALLTAEPKSLRLLICSRCLAGRLKMRGRLLAQRPLSELH